MVAGQRGHPDVRDIARCGVINGRTQRATDRGNRADASIGRR